MAVSLELKIDPEFHRLLPELTADQKKSLKDSIEKYGMLSEVLYWHCNGENILVDGEHRYIACRELGIDYACLELFFESRQEAGQFIIDNVLSRRQLSPNQEAIYRGRKINQEVNSGEKSLNQVIKDEGIPERQAYRDSKVAKQFDSLLPQIQKEILAETTPVRQKDIELLAGVEPDKQREAYRKVKEGSHRTYEQALDDRPAPPPPPKANPKSADKDEAKKAIGILMRYFQMYSLDSERVRDRLQYLSDTIFKDGEP